MSTASASTGVPHLRHRASAGRLHRRCPELEYWLLVGVAWIALITIALSSPASNVHAGHHAAAETQVFGPAAVTAVGWLLMVVAMMVPTALPAVRHVAVNSLRRRQRRAMGLFVAGYVVLWGVFGLAAAAALAVLDAISAGAAGTNGAQRILLVAVLLAAAVFELGQPKLRYLRRCRSTVPLPPSGRPADLACWRAGLRHGASCIGSCWALMLVPVVASHGLALMALVSVIAWPQRLLVAGTRLGLPAAATLVAAAATFTAL